VLTIRHVFGLVTPLLAVCGSLLASACGLSSSSYRVRIDVDVSTLQGIRTGSGVWEIKAGRAFGPKLPEGAKAEVGLVGEAIPIDLSDGRMVFALLRPASDGDSLEDAITSALDPTFKHGATGFLESVPKLAAKERVGLTSNLSPDRYPLLVTFEVPSDPKSVRVISSTRDEKLHLGSVRIRVSLTDQPVTRGIENRLPWLHHLNTSLDGSSITTSTSLSNYLGSRDFTRGK
jgi:hypothetical protein